LKKKDKNYDCGTMVRYLTAPVLAAVAVLIVCWTCSADAAALNVEEQLQLLQAKVNQLEAQVQQHVSIFPK
jgi:hypothetical protein